MLKNKNLNSFYIMAKKYSNEPKINHHSLWPKIGQHLRTLQTSFNLYNGYVCYKNSFIHSFIQDPRAICNFATLRGLLFTWPKHPLDFGLVLWWGLTIHTFSKVNGFLLSICTGPMAPYVSLRGHLYSSNQNSHWVLVCCGDCHDCYVHIFVKGKWVS